MRQVETVQPEREAARGLARPSRRSILTGVGGILGSAGLTAAEPGPPSTITTPPRDFRPNAAPTTYFTDPDVLAVDPAFEATIVPNSAIRRPCFGGPKRNRLFMAASQSLYAVTVNTQGAGPA